MSSPATAAYEMFSSVGKFVMAVDMFPVFFLVHFSIGNVIVREDSKHLGPKFRQKHPFVSWICTLITGLSGVFVANFLFGDPLLDILKENFLIGYLTVIWYLMNYSPYDIVYRVFKSPAVFIPASLVQEVLRLRFLYLGIQTAAKLYPNAPLIMIVGGVIKGNGYGFVKIIERLIRGHWNPQTNEFLDISYMAKSGTIASVLFVLHIYKVLVVPIELLYLFILVAFMCGRFVWSVGQVKDPFAMIMYPISRILFGSWEDERPGKSNADKHDKGTGEDVNKNKEEMKNGNSKRKRDKKKD